MKLTKLGHSCFILDINNTRILFDPGVYTVKYATIENIDIICISHGHADHLDMDLLKEILKNNSPVIITNADVANTLKLEGIEAKVIANGEVININNTVIEAYGEKHIFVRPNFDAGNNIGFLINETFFYPGDNYTLPNKPIEVLAMPSAGPWVKLDEALAYAIKVNPKKVFTVHDSIEADNQYIESQTAKILAENNIIHLDLEANVASEV
jgi:L-ascorbate metabolism protein UlaG (beta-lactamase superfamily)